MPKRLKRLYSRWAIVSWILIVWRVAEMWDTMSFIWEQLSPVGEFLSSFLGTVVVLFIGFGILIYVVVRPEKKEEQKDASQLTQQGTPFSYRQILEDDKSHINNRIFARDYKWWLNKLTEPDPYIDLVFTVINATIFAINIKDVTGRFLIENHECAQEAEIRNLTRIPHGESGNISIRQRLTTEMAKLIISKRKPVEPQKLMLPTYIGKVNINLRACKFLINAEIEGEPQKDIPIAIGADYEVSF